MAKIREARVTAERNLRSKWNIEADAAGDAEHGDVTEVLPILDVRSDDKMQCRPSRGRSLAARDRRGKNDDYQANNTRSDKMWMHARFSAKG
jgi:hypothetical protein